MKFKPIKKLNVREIAAWRSKNYYLVAAKNTGDYFTIILTTMAIKRRTAFIGDAEIGVLGPRLNTEDRMTAFLVLFEIMRQLENVPDEKKPDALTMKLGEVHGMLAQNEAESVVHRIADDCSLYKHFNSGNTEVMLDPVKTAKVFQKYREASWENPFSVRPG